MDVKVEECLHGLRPLQDEGLASEGTGKKRPGMQTGF